MDERPNAIKKEVGKNWQYGRTKKKENRRKKWRSYLLIAVVGINRTWILDKSYRKSNELYFRVADCRPAINETKSFTYLIRLEGPKRTPGVGGVPVALVEWRGRRRRETGGVGGLLRWASAVCCWCGGKRLSCRGENHSKREKFACKIGGGATAVYSI